MGQPNLGRGVLERKEERAHRAAVDAGRRRRPADGDEGRHGLGGAGRDAGQTAETLEGHGSLCRGGGAGADRRTA